MSRLSQLAINDEGFVFDPSTGESFSVNATGVAILKMLKENKSPGEVVDELNSTYDVPEDDTRDIPSDVSDFIEHLRMYKLL